MAKPKKTSSPPAPLHGEVRPEQPPVHNDHVAPVAEPFSDETIAAASPAAEQPEGPPQGIVIAYRDTGTRDDFHRNFFRRSGMPDVRRIDPASLAGSYVHPDPKYGLVESPDPWLRSPDGAVIQVRADHAADLLECDATGSESKWRIATQAEIDGAFDVMKKNTR
jgi:hypothetical protein